MYWWGWMILGAILLGSELLVVDAAFYLVFLGVAAFITGTAVAAGLIPDPAIQFTIFGVLSLISMVTFRRRLYDKLRGNVADYPSTPAGEIVRVTETLPPGESGRQEYRGTTWTVVNRGEETIEAGTDAQIERIDGNNLIVKK